VSFAAEPYGVFVDDILSNLTGGVTREQFRFLVENQPFRLAAGLDALPETVRVHGIAEGDFHRFINEGDYDIVDGLITWRQDPDGTPGDGVTWPDEGTLFWASYERTPDPQDPPRLTDRNPGSIVRTLAESFSREFAVLSMQLDSVYEASFIETASGRDLEQLAALLGLTRRSQSFASGEVIFSRSTPAPADITIPEGAKISTSDVPAVTVETIDDATLRSGTLSVAVPVQALVEGMDGVTKAGSLSVIHRPILGIDRATNSEAVAFGSQETDVMLRRRMRRALQTSGRSTVDALVGAVTSVDGVREQDILVEEDHLAFPGAVKMTIAADLDAAAEKLAVQRIEEFRPAGVRILHDLEILSEEDINPGPGGGGGGDDVVASETATDDDISRNRYPVLVTAGVTPTSPNLTPTEKETLVEKVRVALTDEVALPGLGEPLIYNRMIAAAMAIDGVYDVVLDLQREGSELPAHRFNVYPSPITTRVELAALDISLRGARIALDVTANITLLSFATDLDEAAAKAEASRDIQERLGIGINTLRPENETDSFAITQSDLLGLLPDTETYQVDELSYTAEFVDEGLRVSKANVTITPGPDQVVQIRGVAAN